MPKLKRLLTCSLFLVSSGCDQALGSRKLVVESDTEWSGSIGGDSGSRKKGKGSTRFPVTNLESVCWTFQKETAEGYLRVWAEETTIAGPDKQGFAETTASFGEVTGCSE